MKKVLVKIALTTACGMLVGGCGLGEWVKNGFKVGPNYETPKNILEATTWVDYHDAANAMTQPAVLADWWTVFNDPVLNSLVHDAHAQSLTLRAAGERIAEAASVRGFAVGNLFPQTQNLAGAHTVNKSSDRTSIALPDQWFQDVNAGLNVGWEIDFWGRFRRAIESADASLDASIANYDNVMVLLLSDVASTYVQYRTFQERLYYATQNVEVQRQAYELAQNNFRGGAATERDMQQAKQVYEQTRALIPEFEQGVRQSNNALCALLGIPTQDLSPRLGESGIIPIVPETAVVGIPADLLRRRPDVRQAERIAAAQSAQIGVAKSDLYPHFSLNGSIGLNAEYIGGLWATPGSMAGSFGPSFQWNVLNYGRIENTIKGQEARFREFMYQYEQTVLQADREAEDAMIALTKNKEKVAYLTDSVAAAERTVQITYDQYKAGAVDFTPVFLFELTLTQQQDALTQAKGDIALSLVGLYRALGGGWEERFKSDGIVGPRVTAPATQRTPARPNLINTPATRAATQP